MDRVERLRALTANFGVVISQEELSFNFLPVEELIEELNSRIYTPVAQ